MTTLAHEMGDLHGVPARTVQQAVRNPLVHPQHQLVDAFPGGIIVGRQSRLVVMKAWPIGPRFFRSSPSGSHFC